MSLAEIPPLPDEATYLRLMRRMNSDFYYSGSARIALLNMLLHQTNSSPVLATDRRENVLRIANLLVPYDEITREPVKTGRHIYMNAIDGLNTGMMIIQDVHEGAFYAPDALTLGVRGRIVGTTDPIELRNGMTTSLMDSGAEGLELLGESGRRMIDVWSKEMTAGRDPALRHVYGMSVGLVALSASRLHQQVLQEPSATVAPDSHDNL